MADDTSEGTSNVASRAGVVAGLAVLVAALGFVYWIPIQFVASIGLCCADDGYYSVVAKSLAIDGHYGLPLSSRVFSTFEPFIGNGPALIVPGAAAIRLFGVQTWLPGSTTVALFATQLAVAGFVIARRLDLARALGFVGTFLLGVNLLSGYQWYFGVFVGESSTLGLLLVGAVLLATGESYLNAVLGGLALSLAILTKVIAAPATAAILTAWFVYTAWTRGTRTSLRYALRAAAGVVALSLLFELSKVLVFGPRGYIDYLHQNFLATSALAVGGPGSLADRFTLLRTVLTRDYLVGLAAGLLLVFACGIVCSRRLVVDGRIRLLLAMALTASIASTLYFVFASPMWARYAFVGVTILAIVLAAPVLGLRPPYAVVYAFVMAPILMAATVDRTFMLKNDIARERAEALKLLAANPALPIASISSHSFYDLLYLMGKPEWVLFDRLETLRGRRFLVAINTQFADLANPILKHVEGACGSLMNTTHYRLFKCEPDFWPVPTKLDAVDPASLKAGLYAIIPRITVQTDAGVKIAPDEHFRFFMHPGDTKNASLEFDTQGLTSITLAPFMNDFSGNKDCAGNPEAGVVQVTIFVDGEKRSQVKVDVHYSGTVPVDVSHSSRLKVEVDKGNAVTWCDWVSVGFLDVK